MTPSYRGDLWLMISRLRWAKVCYNTFTFYCGFNLSCVDNDDEEGEEEEEDESIVDKATSSLKELDDSGTAVPKKDKDLPAKLLHRHGSVSNILDASSQDVLNSRAVEVINRIQSKLNGRDFYTNKGPGVLASTVEDQVERLIVEATSVENLCQLFVGWCPFW